LILDPIVSCAPILEKLGFRKEAFTPPSLEGLEET